MAAKELLRALCVILVGVVAASGCGTSTASQTSEERPTQDQQSEVASADTPSEPTAASASESEPWEDPGAPAPEVDNANASGEQYFDSLPGMVGAADIVVRGEITSAEP